MFRKTFIALTVGCVLAGGWGCSGRLPRVHVPPMDPDDVGVAAVAQYDANGDGGIASDELDACAGLRAALERIDLNDDGTLRADEIAERVRKYQKDRIGLFNIMAVISMDGKPFTDAQVTLVPEEFMGTGVQPATGTTDMGGSCMFQTGDSQTRGVQCGVYRIEISKRDARGTETVPPRYNTQSILGVEIGYDSPEVRNGLELSLRSR